MRLGSLVRNWPMSALDLDWQMSPSPTLMKVDLTRRGRFEGIADHRVGKPLRLKDLQLDEADQWAAVLEVAASRRAIRVTL